MQNNTQTQICGIKIDNLSMEEVLFQIAVLIERNEPQFIVTPNVDHIVKLQKDEDFRKVYDAAALILADGVPLLWASKFLGNPLREKISGSDLFPAVACFSAQKGYKLFFLGGREGAADIARDVLVQEFPGLNVVGTYCPSFGFEHDDDENRKIIDKIRTVKPNILFVGLGAPKQEKWISKYYKELDVPVSIGIGVTFEFISGIVRRAPVWMQKSGLEWFWRLLMEPKKLWKRYLIDDALFFWLILKQKFGSL